MNTYLIASESYKLLNEELNKIISKFSNVVKYNLDNDSIKDIIVECNYFSLTGEDKAVIVRSDILFKSSKKEESEDKDIKALFDYLENPNPKCTLIFISSILPDKRKKLYKTINEYNHAIIIPTLNKKELVYKCISILKLKGYIVDYDTANYIVENSYNNYDIMVSEIEKIYILVKEKNLTIDSIKDVVSKGSGVNIYNYVNAIFNRDLKTATKEIDNFEVNKIDPIVILITLYKEFIMLYMINSSDNIKELQLRLHKEDWQMNKYIQNKDLYSIKELKQTIIKLNEYDYKIKSGKIDKDVLLNVLSIDLCN